MLVVVLLLSACRLDVDVSVVMEPDGAGEVTVQVIADEELVSEVPNLVGDLRLDDAITNGWVIEGPTPTETGGLAMTLRHPFSSADDLANVLNSIGPPLSQMAVARTTVDDQTTNGINGELILASGFDSFADADLIAAANGLPFADKFALSGLQPAESMSFVFRVSLPGELVSSKGTEVAGGAIEWTAPLDGTSVNLLTQTVQRPAGTGGAWAGPLSTISLIALIVWLIVATAFIGFVVVARGAKRRRRERALRNLH
jgi:hypothetical protein